MFFFFLLFLLFFFFLFNLSLYLSHLEKTESDLLASLLYVT